MTTERVPSQRKFTLVFPSTANAYDVRLSVARTVAQSERPIVYSYKDETELMTVEYAKKHFPNTKRRLDKPKVKRV